MAVNVAISICQCVLGYEDVFKEFGLTPILQSNPLKEIKTETIKDVLFEYVKSTNLKFYYMRGIDNKVEKSLELFSIWIYGKSGLGKSNTLLQNLISNNKDYINISLAGCINSSVNHFFKEIYFEIGKKNNETSNNIVLSDFNTILKEITNLLNKYYHKKQVTIFIDEIPLEGEVEFKDFSEKIFAFMTLKSNIENHFDLKLVLSTISSPEKHIKATTLKISEYCEFIEFNDWSLLELNGLFKLLNDELKIQLSQEEQNLIVSSSSGSPRFIKKLLKNYIIKSDQNNGLDHIIEITKNQMSF